MAKAKSIRKTDKKESIGTNVVPFAPVETQKTVEAVTVAPGTNGADAFELASSEAKKQENSKPELWGQTVPVTLHDEISRRAYELYAQRGFASGNPTDDWLVAEREVMQRYNHHSA